jgi:osmoprotectant transport system permease protein
LITEGIQTFFPTKYLLGAALSVLLAFSADFLFVRVERLMTPWARARAGAV